MERKTHSVLFDHRSAISADKLITDNTPNKFGDSGKNSERIGSVQPCLRMMGLTSEATRCNIDNARSACGRSLRCVKDLTNVSDIYSSNTEASKGL